MIHHRDAEPDAHIHKRGPWAKFDKAIMRGKDLIIVGSAIWAIWVTTNRWIMKPAELERSANTQDARITAVESQNQQQDKVLRDLTDTSIRNSDKLDDVVYRTKRIETLLDALTVKRTNWHSDNIHHSDKDNG